MSIWDLSWQASHPSWFEHLHSPAVLSKKDKHTHGLHSWHLKTGLPMYSYTPDVDLRETDTTFFLDLELPGVSDKSSIKIHWASSRLLIIEGEITRPKVEAPLGPASTVDQNSEADNTDKSDVNTKHQPRPHQPSLYPEVDGVRLTMCERKIGHYIRNFSFPVDVDRHGLKARLDAGLLQIQMPKWQQSDDKWKVEID